MPFSKDKADLKRRFGDNPDAIAQYLTEAFAENELAPVLRALAQIVRGQNVKALARKTGMGREGLHRSFAGEVRSRPTPWAAKRLGSPTGRSARGLQAHHGAIEA